MSRQWPSFPFTLQAAEAASLAAAHEDVAGAHSQQAAAAAEVEVDAVAERQPTAGATTFLPAALAQQWVHTHGAFCLSAHLAACMSS